MLDDGDTPLPLEGGKGEKPARDLGVSAGRLKSFVQRIERLEEERKALGADLREVYSEAKGGGFDTRIIRQVVKLRKIDKADRQEMDALLQVYLEAVGD